MFRQSVAGLRALLPVSALLLVIWLIIWLIIWGGFEIRDEAVAKPSPRAVRPRAPGTETGGSVEYVEGYEAGLRRAIHENRPLLVVFRASWCHWCAELARGALVDRRLVGLSRHFICVAIDADRHAADCRRFGVKEFPTVVVASPEGEERRRWKGCPSADELVSAMADTVPGVRMAAIEDDETTTTR